MPTLMSAYQVLLGGISGEDMPDGTIRAMQRVRGLARWQVARGAGPTSSAAMALAYTATHREWLAADAVGARLRHDIGEVFDRFDAILAPITPVVAFPHDHRGFTRRRLTTSDSHHTLRLHAQLDLPGHGPAFACDRDSGRPCEFWLAGRRAADRASERRRQDRGAGPGHRGGYPRVHPA